MLSIIKCVVVGDKAVGKTTAINCYANNYFLAEYVPTVFDNYVVTEAVYGYQYTLNLFDTSGRESNDELRTLCYQNASIFLVCFSVVRPESFDSVKQKWVPEIIRFCGHNAQYILVGTQIDLRNENTDQRAVTREDGEILARELRAVKYAECSALTQYGLKNVFDEAISAAISPSRDSLVQEPIAQQRPVRQCCPIM